MLSDLPSERTRAVVDQAHNDFGKSFVCKPDLPDPPVLVDQKKGAAAREAGPSSKGVKAEKGEQMRERRRRRVEGVREVRVESCR